MSSNLVRESWKVLGPRVRLPFANLSGTGAFSSMGMKPRETKTQLPSEVGVINLETVCFLSTWSKRVEHNQTSPSLDQSDANSNLSFLTDTAKCADLVSKIIDRWWYRTQDLPITSQPCQPPRTFNSCLFFSLQAPFWRKSDEFPTRTARGRVASAFPTSTSTTASTATPRVSPSGSRSARSTRSRRSHRTTSFETAFGSISFLSNFAPNRLSRKIPFTYFFLFWNLRLRCCCQSRCENHPCCSWARF